jgi:hypothetical protein
MWFVPDPRIEKNFKEMQNREMPITSSKRKNFLFGWN